MLKWCRHSSVDSSAPSILPPQVRLPGMPSLLLSFIAKFVLYLSMQCEKRTKINKKQVWPIFLKKNRLKVHSIQSTSEPKYCNRRRRRRRKIASYCFCSLTKNASTEAFAAKTIWGCLLRSQSISIIIVFVVFFCFRLLQCDQMARLHFNTWPFATVQMFPIA